MQEKNNTEKKISYKAINAAKYIFIVLYVLFIPFAIFSINYILTSYLTSVENDFISTISVDYSIDMDAVRESKKPTSSTYIYELKVNVHYGESDVVELCCGSEDIYNRIGVYSTYVNNAYYGEGNVCFNKDWTLGKIYNYDYLNLNLLVCVDSKDKPNKLYICLYKPVVYANPHSLEELNNSGEEIIQVVEVTEYDENMNDY